MVRTLMRVIRKGYRNGSFQIFFEIRDESNGFALALLMIVPENIREAVLPRGSRERTGSGPLVNENPSAPCATWPTGRAARADLARSRGQPDDRASAARAPQASNFGPKILPARRDRRHNARHSLRSS